MDSFIQNNQKIISVSDVNNLAKGLLEKELSNIWIQGEISNFTAHGSGHWYFTIKDQDSSLSCVMFKFDNLNLLFKPKVGDELILNGNISIYSPTGRYQFNVKHIEVSGEGALLRAFEDLKKKLELEGLFDEHNKKELPDFPLYVSVITSATGAVLKDIINVLKRRSPLVHLTLIETPVQGKQAEKSICESIEKANDYKEADLIILARGGGSIEDLWCFNMESVARAIFKSEIPLISAIGHETDFTISDFVSDLRAPTPSAAAEIISQNHSNLLKEISSTLKQLHLSIGNSLKQSKDNLLSLSKLIRRPGDKLREISQKFDGLEIQVINQFEKLILISKNELDLLASSLNERSPSVLLQNYGFRLESSSKGIEQSVIKILKDKKSDFLRNLKTLEAVSPLSVLSRGYSILTKGKSNEVISSSSQLTIGEEIEGKLSQGKILTKVIDISDGD